MQLTPKTFLQSIHLPSLSPEQLDNLNIPFNEKDISLINTLKHFINTSFFTCVMFKLARRNAHCNYNHYPKTWKKNTITAVYFRLICLLNFDLKAQIIANRIFLLTSIIKNDQEGFTKGHQAPDKTRHLNKPYHEGRLSVNASLLMSLNAENEFDEVPWAKFLHIWNSTTSTTSAPILSTVSSLYFHPLASALLLSPVPTHMLYCHETPSLINKKQILYKLYVDDVWSNFINKGLMVWNHKCWGFTSLHRSNILNISPPLKYLLISKFSY